MKIRYITTCMLLSILPWAAHATTLEQAMNMVKEKHPKLAMSALDNDVARAQLSSQSSYAYNPELSVEIQDRKLNGGGRGTDYYIGLSQGIEIGGKGSYRKQAAQAVALQSKLETEVLRLSLIIDAANTFVRLNQAAKILSIREQQSALYFKLQQGVKRQLDVGDANILQANLATSAYAAALSAQGQAKQDMTLALNQYNQAMGTFSGNVFQPELPTLNVQWQAPQNAYALAIRANPEIKLAKAKMQQTTAQAELANASRFVDPTISLMAGEEAGEQLFKLGISIPLPLTNGKKGEYQAALAQAERSQSQALWLEKRLRLDVQSAVRNHQQAMNILTMFTAQQPNDNSITLAQTAFDAGELSLEDLVLHINQALDAKLTALSLLHQAWFTRIELARVLGHPEYILQGIEQ